MPSHAIRILTSPEPAAAGQPSREDREAALLAAFGAVLAEQSQPAVTVTPGPGDTVPEHVLAQHRVSDSAKIDAVLDAIAGQLTDRAWWAIDYHLCHNAEFQPCQPWARVRRQGDVPEGI